MFKWNQVQTHKHQQHHYNRECNPSSTFCRWKRKQSRDDTEHPTRQNLIRSTDSYVANKKKKWTLQMRVQHLERAAALAQLQQIPDIKFISYNE
jgi:hypothetical protein